MDKLTSDQSTQPTPSTVDSAAQRASANEAGAHDDGSPKFGRLLIVLLVAVMFCGLLTWVMAEFFPHFPG